MFTPTYDPLEVVRSLFMVRTKSARVVPFNLFRTQQLFCARLGLHNAAVKPRQVGLSTIILGLNTACAITTPNLNILTVTHRDDTTETMRSTIKGFISNLNHQHNMGIELGRDNEEMLEIRTTGSTFFFGSSTAPGVGRSRTIHILHASELAHWLGANPGAELGAMTESVPDHGMIFIESTPNGADGPFYDIYNAKDPLPELSQAEPFVKHFFPWFLEPSRRIPLNDKRLHLTDEERRLLTMYKLTHEQIAWRRWKWRQLESQGMYFPQEYPEDDRSCFTAGLRSVYPMQLMSPLFDMARGAAFADYDRPGDPQDPGGVLRIWEDPRPGLHYIATGDVGGGHVDGDPSYLVVRCRENGRHVASLIGHWSPDRFGRDSVDVAIRYNNAYLSHESTGLGISAVNAAISRGYTNYHFESRGLSSSSTFNPSELKPGFNVSPTSRLRMLTRLLEEATNGRFHTFDENILRQMTAARFERVRHSGGWIDSIVVPASQHDDGMMAMAQNLLVSDQAVFTDDARARPAHGA